MTGASGFIGRRLAAELVRRGDDVACLVRPESRTAPLRDLPVTFVPGDLGDTDSLVPAVSGRDRVFHVAGLVQAATEAAFETANAAGTRRLVEACLRAVPVPGRFVLVSSVAAAGPSGPDRPRVETDPPRPVSAYGRSKLAAEEAVRAAAGRLPATIVRPPNVLGPGSKEIEAAIGLLRLRLSPSVADGRPRTSLIDVDDLVEALILASEHPRAAGETYFVTDGATYAWPAIVDALAAEMGSVRSLVRVPYGVQLAVAGLAESLARAAGRPPRITRDIVRAGRDHFWLYDGSKIVRDLGFLPSRKMRDSVRAAAAAAQAPRGRRTGREARP